MKKVQQSTSAVGGVQETGRMRLNSDNRQPAATNKQVNIRCFLLPYASLESYIYCVTGRRIHTCHYTIPGIRHFNPRVFRTTNTGHDCQVDLYVCRCHRFAFIAAICAAWFALSDLQNLDLEMGDERVVKRIKIDVIGTCRIGFLLVLRTDHIAIAHRFRTTQDGMQRDERQRDRLSRDGYNN